MLRSLVGSKMCIRDSYVLILAVLGPLLAKFNPPIPSLASMKELLNQRRDREGAVTP